MKLKLKANSMREPPGGHYYVELGVTIEGDRFSEVVDKLTEFRINNGIPLCEPDQDILKFYARKWEYLVEEDFSEQVDYKPLKEKRTRWTEWVHLVWRNPPKNLAPVKEAKERWEMCKSCPHNVELESSSSQEDAETERRSFLLRRGQEVPKYLHFCSFHGMPLDVGCFLDNANEFSSSKAGEKYDPCWLNKAS